MRKKACTEGYIICITRSIKENSTVTRAAKGVGERSLAVRLLLSCGAIGPLLFIVVFLIEGATRPDYSAWHNAVSSLSLGGQGWMQIANFFICGVLVFCFAIGLRRVLYPGKGSTWGPILLGIFSLCLIGAGFFVTDPGLGYPPGAPYTPSTPTLHGVLHGVFSLVGFISLPMACFVLARRFVGDPAWHGWTFYSIATGILVVIFFFATGVAESPNPNAPVGLIQRLSIIIGWGWMALLALRLMRKGTPIDR